MSQVFKSPFVPKKNIKRGHLARNIGETFEALLVNSCARDKMNCVRIPDGCKMVRTRSGAVIPRRTTTPFDFLITHEGFAACIDCKTIDSGNFSHSMLTSHQVNSLSGIHGSGVAAGYLVWFRDTDQIVFFNAKLLQLLKPRESLRISQGINLGTHKIFSLKSILARMEPIIERAI